MGPQTSPATPPAAGQPAPLDVPPPQPPVKDRKSLAIALVVAGVLLLASIGIGIWLFVFSPKSAQVVGNANTSTASPDDSTKDVKKVSFVAPPTLPPTYTKRDQSTAESTTVFYFNDATACGFALNVLTLGATFGNTPKEAIMKSANAAEAIGVTTVKSSDAAPVTIKDAASGAGYAFSAIELEQDVNVEGVDFKKQFNTVIFKQFGNQVASISYSCKAGEWETKKAELQAIAQAFTVKTEK